MATPVTAKKPNPSRRVSASGSHAKYRIEFFEEDGGNKPVLRWIRETLSSRQRAALGKAMRLVLQRDGVQVCGSRYGRQLGNGLFEFRLDENLGEILSKHGIESDDVNKEPLLLRVFCHAHGDRIILLLGAYDKGKAPSNKRQNSEIAVARGRLRAFITRKKN